MTRTTRCEEVLVQIVLRSYDESGRPIGEATTQPIKLFRAGTPDFWAVVDELVQQRVQHDLPAPVAPVPSNGSKTRRPAPVPEA